MQKLLSMLGFGAMGYCNNVHDEDDSSMKSNIIIVWVIRFHITYRYGPLIALRISVMLVNSSRWNRTDALS